MLEHYNIVVVLVGVIGIGESIQKLKEELGIPDSCIKIKGYKCTVLTELYPSCYKCSVVKRVPSWLRTGRGLTESEHQTKRRGEKTLRE